MHDRKISVIGIGGCGRTIINKMFRRGNLYERSPAGTTSFLIADSYPNELFSSAQDEEVVFAREGKILLPKRSPEALAKIRASVTDVPLVLLAVGLGGITGTTLAPVVGKVAREAGALVICLAALPFGFEGNRRSERAIDNFEALRESVDTLVLVPVNTQDVQCKGIDECLHAACAVCAEVGIAFHEDLLRQDRIAFDLADYREIFRDGRLAVPGFARGTGQDARQMAEDAFALPLAAGLFPESMTSVFLRVAMPPEAGIDQLAEFTGAAMNMLHKDVPFYLSTTHAESGEEEEMHALLVAVGDVPFH